MVGSNLPSLIDGLCEYTSESSQSNYNQSQKCLGFIPPRSLITLTIREKTQLPQWALELIWHLYVPLSFGIGQRGKLVKKFNKCNWWTVIAAELMYSHSQCFPTFCPLSIPGNCLWIFLNTYDVFFLHLYLTSKHKSSHTLCKLWHGLGTTGLDNWIKNKDCNCWCTGFLN